MNLAQKLENLRQPIPKSMISFKKLKGNKIEYISWIDICQLLDSCCGLDGWSWEICDTKQIGDNLTLVGKLTVYADDGHRSMSATGCESINCSSYGDPSSNAEAMAFRRAAAKLGLARNLWKKGANLEVTNEQWRANGLKYYVQRGLTHEEAQNLVKQSRNKQELMEVGRLAVQEKHSQRKEKMNA